MDSFIQAALCQSIDAAIQPINSDDIIVGTERLAQNKMGYSKCRMGIRTERQTERAEGRAGVPGLKTGTNSSQWVHVPHLGVPCLEPASEGWRLCSLFDGGDRDPSATSRVGVNVLFGYKLNKGQSGTRSRCVWFCGPKTLYRHCMHALGGCNTPSRYWVMIYSSLSLN